MHSTPAGARPHLASHSRYRHPLQVERRVEPREDRVLQSRKVPTIVERSYCHTEMLVHPCRNSIIAQLIEAPWKRQAKPERVQQDRRKGCAES